MRLLAALVAAFLCSCSYQPELLLGCGPRSVNRHIEGACSLQVIQRFGERGFCTYRHGSEPQDGRGGDETEYDVSVDTTQCGVRWGGDAR